jgi:hypothetical protein
MINKMVDLETWGKRAGCAIRSIAHVCCRKVEDAELLLKQECPWL